jgi:O-antigen ligase
MLIASLLQRAAWGAAALASVVLLSGLASIEHVPLWLTAAVFVLAAISLARPSWGLVFAAATIPIAGYTMRLAWNPAVPWAEVVVLAVSAGWCARRAALPESGVSPTIVVSILLALIVMSSIVATIALDGITMGAGLRPALVEHVTRTYFIFPREFLGLHVGLQIIEGLGLCTAAAVFIARRAGALRVLCGAVVAGSAAAAVIEVVVFGLHAARTGPFWTRPFWTSLARQLAHVRWTHFADVNAAGSYFVMTVIAAIALARVSRGPWRAASIVAALCGMGGLWLSGSRVAMLAGVLAMAAGVLLHRRGTARRAFAIGAGTLAVTALLLTAIWLYMPLRGNQKPADIAVSVRAGMAAAALGMIHAHPAFGIGVGQFTTRAGEFVSAGVLAIFPAAHENAHNDFLQIGAELGLPGLALFLALLVAAARGGEPQSDDALRAGMQTAVAAFVLSGIGGHPLLTREVSYTFWLLLGCVAGGAAPRTVPRRFMVTAGAAAIVAIAATTPLRTRTLLADANLDHAGVGVSLWQTAPDGIRYREADEAASVFVPASGAFGLSVQPLVDKPVRLEVRLDGRTIDVVGLSPGRWTDLAVPARDRLPRTRYSRLDLRLLDASPHTKLWITKDHPIG